MGKSHGNLLQALRRACLSSTIALALAGTAWAQQGTTVADYDVPAGNLAQGVNRISQQGGVQIIYDIELLKGKQVPALRGRLTFQQALEQALTGTGLTYEFLNPGTVVLKPGDRVKGPDPVSSRRREAVQNKDDIVGMPAIMVQGARTLNTDITRTRDDPQPYVIFDRDIIERSGAASIEQFLQQRLPMNTAVGSVGGAMQAAGTAAPSLSTVNLRGLGASQTLILVDGHRVSSPALFGRLTQGEISGIPLASIERIEILPTTASGIYGGSATGGVVNIITRKDYTGGEVRLTYDNTFDSDTATRKFDFTFGHSFNQGRTSLLLSGSYLDANELRQADRNLVRRGRENVFRNDPGFFIGNPPIGFTPNISSTDGSELVLKSGTPLGASYTSVPVGYAGASLDGGAAFLTNAGSYNWDLANNSLGARQSLYNEPTAKSGSLVLRHRIGEDTQVYADLASSETVRRFMNANADGVRNYLVPADSIHNPFMQDIAVAIPFLGVDEQQVSTSRNQRAVVGLIRALANDWKFSADYTWDRSRGNYAGGVIEDGGLIERDFAGDVVSGLVDILRDPNAFPIDFGQYMIPMYRTVSKTTMKDANLRLSGPLGRLSGGKAVLSTAIAHRTESMPDILSTLDPEFHMFYPSRSVSVPSAYMEYRMPFFSQENARPGLRVLELQLAARWEKYVSKSGGMRFLFGESPAVPDDIARDRNEFSSVDPTIALRWSPWETITLRASYGTGFLPPSLDRLVATYRPNPIVWGVDPLRGNTDAGPYARITDGNPGLRPEQSESWSAGMIFEPDWFPGLRLSLDYTQIKKTDVVSELPGDAYQETINNEALFPGRVVRGERAEDDPPGWAGPIVLIDISPLNLASAKLEAWDFQVDYRKETEQRGYFDFFMAGTWQPHYAIQAISTQPSIEYAGIGSDHPLKLKANLGLTWSFDAWRAGWNANYFDSYRIREAWPWNPWASGAVSQGDGGRVASQTYHDVFVSYDFRLSGATMPGWLAKTQLQVGVRNLFDKAPPYDATNALAFYSPFGSPRMSSYYLSLVTEF